MSSGSSTRCKLASLSSRSRRAGCNWTPANLPFFPNPVFLDRAPRSGADRYLDLNVDHLMWPLLDTIPWLAADTAQPASTNGNATPAGDQIARVSFGRKAELESLSSWIDGPGTPVRVVTGKPGVGKSALLGIMVAAAHPKLRKHTTPFWQGLDAYPHEQDTRFCAVHARGRTLPEIIDGLARQLGLPPSGQANTLIRLMAGFTDGTPIVVIDAVDEARDADGLVKALLLRLATTRRPDGITPACRLLIGSRVEPWLTPLIEAGGDHARLDLDKTDTEALRNDLVLYLKRLLEADGPYTTASMEPVLNELVRAAAAALTGDDERSGLSDCGEFLAAGMFAQRLLSGPVATDEAQARTLGATAPRTLEQVLDVDLEQRRSPWLRPLLMALAYAYGDGMPEILIREAMRAIRWGRAGGPAPTIGELDLALRYGQFYLRRSIDSGGRTLYRLFHQADRLREPGRADSHD